MSAETPRVEIRQEQATAVVTAATPPLASLIAGPCYHIQDYPADKSGLNVGAYGTRTGDNDPLALLKVTGVPNAGSDALIVADPPGNVVGAQLDQASVRLWAEDAHLIVLTGSAGEFSASPDDNEFIVAGADFGAAGGRPGDRLVITDPLGGTTVAFTILSLGGVDGSTDAATILRTTENFAAAGTDINGDAYMSLPTSGLDWRIERVLTSAILLEDAALTYVGNEITLGGGLTYLTDLNEDGNDAAAVVSYANLYLSYRSLRQDLARVIEVDAGTVETVLGRFDERNPLRVGADLALLNGGDVTIYVFGVTGDDLNGVADADAAYNVMYGLSEDKEDVYAIAPLSQDASVRDAGVAHVEALEDPSKSQFRALIANYGPLPSSQTIGTASLTGQAESVAGDDPSVLASADFSFLTAGVRAGDQLVIENDVATTREGSFAIDRVYDENRLFSAELGAAGAVASDDIQYYIFRGSTGTVLRTISGADITAVGADEVTVPVASASADDIGRVIRLLISAGGNNDTSPVGNNDYLITDVDTGTGVYSLVSGSGTWSDETLDVAIVDTLASEVDLGGTGTAADTRAPFRQLLDPSASFVTSGVVVTDTLEVPTPAVSAGADFSASLYSGVITAVVSNQRVRLASDEDIPTTNILTGQTDIGYRVRRSLDKAGQRDLLVDVVDPVTGYSYKRHLLVFPDEVLVEGLTNVSTGVASRQPGYYAAACVAGLSAGLPPQQGLTNRTIQGISEIYQSSRYFSRDQVEDISNAGFFVFVQPEASNPPYVLHQLSTDTSSVLKQEFSILRSLDFASRSLKAVIRTFIGRTNITPETLGLLRESVVNTIDSLRSNRRPNIGAPIVSGEIISLGTVDGAPDTVELVTDLQPPYPLNKVRVVIRS